MMAPIKRRFVSSSSSVEVAAPPKKLKATSSSSSSTSPLANKNTTPDWLPDGWTVAVLTKPTGHKYKVFKETATGKKFYSKPQVLNYLDIPDTNLSNNTNVNVAPPKEKQVSTLSTTPSERPRGRFTTDSFDDIKKMLTKTSASASRPVGVAPPKKLKEPTRRRTSMQSHTSSTTEPVKVAPPQTKQVKVSTLSTTPSEIPKPLYDLIQYAARARKSLKLNSNNRFAKRKLKYYEPRIPRLANYLVAITKELAADWKYDPETSFMAHVPKPPSPPKPKPKPKRKKKKIKITWSSPNYHGRYRLNSNEQKVWNQFTINDSKTKANSVMDHPNRNLITVEDDVVVDLLGKFAVDTFNKSCHLYVDRDIDNMVSEVEFMECKFYKMTKKYIFYLTIEAIEQGMPGVYTSRVECKTKDGTRTLMNFQQTDDKPKGKPKGNRPWYRPQQESEINYETVEDDPQDFYLLTGLVHRWTRSGFDYHNPEFSPSIVVYQRTKIHDEDERAFVPNVSLLPKEFM